MIRIKCEDVLGVDQVACLSLSLLNGLNQCGYSSKTAVDLHISSTEDSEGFACKSYGFDILSACLKQLPGPIHLKLEKCGVASSLEGTSHYE